jgi:hypothetical protein
MISSLVYMPLCDNRCKWTQYLFYEKYEIHLRYKTKFVIIEVPFKVYLTVHISLYGKVYTVIL